MQLGMIGLGRMGANMSRRLMDVGIRMVVHDIDEHAVEAVERDGAAGARTLEALVELMDAPRRIWIMVPAGYVGGTVDRLAPLLDRGDTIIDGGNSLYRHDIDRSARLLDDYGVNYIDVGTSGGIHGFERGYCLMVGGEPECVADLAPVFDALAPGVGDVERTPGRTGEPSPAERGWLHCGPSGAGHFVKMVHNGIEYGAMAAYAEGLNILATADIGMGDRPEGAESVPPADAPYYRYDFDLAAITEVWRRGSVITSWLLDLTAEALLHDPRLDDFSGSVSDSGEGRWAVNAAVDEGVPVPVLSAALFQRFSSRGRSLLSDKVLSAMRAGFGGHGEAPADD